MLIPHSKIFSLTLSNPVLKPLKYYVACYRDFRSALEAWEAGFRTPRATTEALIRRFIESHKVLDA
jgi:hypothetical protein